MKTLLGLLAILGITTAAGAEDYDDGRLQPVENGKFRQECGGCHMAFPPQLLPARSWERMMGELKEHFGENATLDDATRAEITRILVANAADSGVPGIDEDEILRGIDHNTAPLRITATPYWVVEHEEEVPPGAYARPEVGSASNCPACHKRADQGDFDL